MAVLIIFSEAAPANGVDTAFYIFTVVSLPSGSATTVYLSPLADFKQVKFHIFIFAGVAELADALASGASVRKDVWVQVPPSAPRKARIYELFFFAQ